MSDTSLHNFRTRGNNLSHWQKKADSLLLAAQILRTYAGTNREAHWGTLWPELMLWGFAIEALLKALKLKNALQSRNPKHLLYQDGKLRARTHDLVQLAREAHFPLDEFQRKLLEQLTTAVTLGGRYPVTTNEELDGYYWYGSKGDHELDSMISALKQRLPSDPVSYQKDRLSRA